MVSSNEMQITHSDPVMPPTPTPVEPSAAGSAQEETQLGNGGARSSSVTHASDNETNALEQSQGESIPSEQHLTVTDIATGSVGPQQQGPTEAAGDLSIPRTTTASNESLSDHDKDSDSDNGENETDHDDDYHSSDFDDGDDIDPDQEEADAWPDSAFVPISPTGEAASDHDPGNPTTGLLDGEGDVGGHQDHQEVGPLHADIEQEVSIADDLRNYAQPMNIDGRMFEDYAETVSEDDAWDFGDGHTAERFDDVEASPKPADRTIWAASAEPAHGDGGVSRSVMGSPTGSDHDNEWNRRSLTPALAGRDHGNGSSNASPEPTPAGSSHEDEVNDDPMTNTPAGPNSNFENREDCGSMTLSSSNHGDEESSNSVTITPAAEIHHSDGNSSKSETITPAGSNHAIQENNSPLPSGIAPGQITSALSPKSSGKQKETAEDEVPEASGAPTEAIPSNAAYEREIQDHAATLANDRKGTVSRADAETDDGQKAVNSLSQKMADSTLKPTAQLGGQLRDYDLDHGEAAANSADRVFARNEDRTREVKGVDADVDEEGCSAEGFGNGSEGVE